MCYNRHMPRQLADLTPDENNKLLIAKLSVREAALRFALSQSEFTETMLLATAHELGALLDELGLSDCYRIVCVDTVPASACSM